MTRDDDNPEVEIRPMQPGPVADAIDRFLSEPWTGQRRERPAPRPRDPQE